jgi:hypothetical protein
MGQERRLSNVRSTSRAVEGEWRARRKPQYAFDQ